MSVFSRLVVTTLPVVPKFVVGKVASRYVAGSTMEDALRTVKRLNGDGAMATLDILGEEVQEAEKTHAAVEQYLALYREIADRGLDANVSVKPTMLGLKIDRGIFRDHILRLAEAAAKRENFLRMDMEDRTTTDDTLSTYREIFPRFPNIGVVLQAYMRRTLKDIDGLPAEGGNVRLCKGIYI
ncbi:MAG: proline dehydrogenase family protein, partial [Acidobacteria bacterium]|nr:proline dehydrogenase family protein [Acidobacteriota bacterium]